MSSKTPRRIHRVPQQNRPLREGPVWFLSLPLAGGISESEKQVWGNLGRKVVEAHERFIRTGSSLGSGGIYHESRICRRSPPDQLYSLQRDAENNQPLVP